MGAFWGHFFFGLGEKEGGLRVDGFGVGMEGV